MEEKQLYLTEETINVIKDKIQEELLKRGITAPIIKFKEYIDRNGNHKIELKTEDFQTSPVIFKRLWVDIFGTEVYIPKEEESTDHYNIWIVLDYSYEHFGGGRNGCTLFTFRCSVSLDNEHVYKIIIN